MGSNARLFGDDLGLSAIFATDDPREQKRLDRHLRHFDHDFWQHESEHLVLRGNLAKSVQNEKMRLALVHTGRRRLVEASAMKNCGASARMRATPREQRPRQSSAPLWRRPLAKGLRTYRPARQHCVILTEDEIRLAFGYIGQRRLAKPALMINCGAPA